MEQILITGATSQIGRFLLPLLVENGYSIIALSRNEYESGSEIKWIKCNIKDSKLSILKNKEIETIIHLAEVTLLPNIIQNLKGVKRIIAFSSTSALTKINSNNTKDKNLALTLLDAERTFIQLSNNNLIHWTIFRPTLIYGAKMDKNITFIINFIQKYSFFPILGKGEGLRQPVHALDLAHACLNAKENPNTYNKIYNLTGLETLSYRRMIEKIFLSINKRIVIIRIPKFIFSSIVKTIMIFPRYRHLTTGMVDRLDQDLCFDISEAKKDFGYSPKSFMPNKDLGDV